MTAEVTLRQMHYFVILSEELNYRRAAERLHITQPALSTSIKHLERQVGVTLFARNTREVVPTTEGELWLPAVQDALEGAQRALNRVETLAGPDGAVLRVGYLVGTGADQLFTLIRAFESRYPRTTVEAVEYDFADPTAGLGGGSTDVALIRPPVDLPDHAMLVVDTEAWVTCLPVDHPLARRDEVAIDDLLQEPIICAPESAGLWRDYWMALECRGAQAPTIGGVSPTYETEATLVSRGLGISFTTESMARLYQRPGITYVPITGRPPSYTALAWDPHRLTPAAEALLEMARESSGAVTVPFETPDLGYSLA